MAPRIFHATRFADVWNRARLEKRLTHDGPVGELVSLFGEYLDVEQIHYVDSDNEIGFVFDLTPLGLSGMGYNLLVVSRPPQDDAEATAQARFLLEQKEMTDSVGFCFQLYLSDQPVERNPFVATSHEAVFLNRTDLEQIFSSAMPKLAFASIIRKQTPVSRLCPFNTNMEASGAMFFGRRTELNAIIDDLITSYVVQGARRIGKTSLLKQGYRTLRSRWQATDPRRVFFFNCLTWSNYSHACHMLAHLIDPRREFRLERAERNIQYLLERASRGGARPLYLFFDEVDRLIDLDAVSGWRFFNLLAWAKDSGYIRFVLAGYRSISRLVYGQDRRNGFGTGVGATFVPAPDTPLLLALEPVTLGPLARKEADGLLAEPLKNTEIAIQNEPAVLESVWKATSGYPFLVQFFGQHLFKTAFDRNPQTISPEDVAEVEQGAALHELLKSHFIENTIFNGMPAANERGCAYLFAHSKAPHWTEQDFWEACQKHRIPLGTDSFGAVHHALKSLCDAQILGYDHGRYSFAFPAMRSVLTNSYPAVAIGIQALTGIAP